MKSTDLIRFAKSENIVLRLKIMSEVQNLEEFGKDLVHNRIIEKRDFDGLVGINVQITDRTKILSTKRLTDDLDATGFVRVFDETLERTDIGINEIHVVLKLLVGQAWLYLSKWECEHGYNKEMEEIALDTNYDPVVKKYNRYDHDYSCRYTKYVNRPRPGWIQRAKRDCKAWFQNPDFANHIDAKRYSCASVSWCALDILKLQDEKNILLEQVMTRLILSKRSGIDDLFEGNSDYGSYTWNDRADLLRLMQSVLHNIANLMKMYNEGEKQAHKIKIIEYLDDPYFAHLNSIHDKETCNVVRRFV